MSIGRYLQLEAFLIKTIIQYNKQEKVSINVEGDLQVDNVIRDKRDVTSIVQGFHFWFRRHKRSRIRAAKDHESL